MTIARALGIVLAVGCASGEVRNGGLGPTDSAAVRAGQAEYVAAWLKDDTTAVLATLDSNAVLMPPRLTPVVGHAAIRAHWWPQDGSRTRIATFSWDVAELGGTGPFAYTRGESRLTWTYDKDTVHQESGSRSVNITLLRRTADGSWRITHQMWGPPLP